MERWVLDFDSWDVCDTTCGKLFKKVPLAYKKSLLWAESDRLFTRRAGFALMAFLSLKSSKLSDAQFAPFLKLIIKHASDDRNLVKKSVNWALRQIGKKNSRLHLEALETCNILLQEGSSSANWISRDAVRELESDQIKKRLGL